MPMYEKGSVRAEPRSKQQERMKKIMKKFLSSLLALTMILSLVIVPAQAVDSPLTITGESSVNIGHKITLTAPSVSKVTVEGTDYDVHSIDKYVWTSSNTNYATVKSQETTTRTNEVTGVAAGDTSINCTIHVTYDIPAHDAVAARMVTTTVNATAKTVTVSSDLSAAVNSVTVNDRTYTASPIYIYTQDGSLRSIDFAPSLKNGYTPAEENGVVYDSGNNKLTITDTNGNSVEWTVTQDTATVSASANPTTVISGGQVTLTATPKDTVKGAKYSWYYKVKDSNAADTRIVEDSSSATTTWTVPSDLSEATTYTVTCKLKAGNAANVATDTDEVTVNTDPYTLKYPTSVTVTSKDHLNLLTSSKVKLCDNRGNIPAGEIVYNFESKNESIVTVGPHTGIINVVGTGETRIAVSATYMGKTYGPYNIKVTAAAMEYTFSDSVTNGDPLDLSSSTVERAVVNAINGVYGSGTIKSSDISHVVVTTLPTSSSYDSFYIDNRSKTDITRNTDITNEDICFDANEGFIGKASFKVTVNSTYEVTLYIDVTADDTIDATVNGSTANSSVSFKVSDAVDYSYLYIYGTSSTPSTTKPSNYDGLWTKTTTTASGSWERYSSSSTITVPSKSFSSGKATLYVVGLDSDGVASTGTITVSQKSYDITYNVVAGKSVTFDQKAFDSFLEDIADDSGDYNSRKDDLSFSYAVLTSSVPSTKSEGTLYDGSTEITSSNKSKTKMTDMDKVSFETVSKPSKDTIPLTFRVYGDLYKDGSRTKKEVKYDVNVVISVVKEDITYTVGIDDTVQLTARDFVNFLQDAKTSYRKAELDYVKFDVSGKNVSSYAYGGLYRSYSSYSTGKLADSTDKFYYEPSRTQYDLADVAYHTTRWAEAGKTVYIPFTVYGTKNEEASGTMAITIAQTMNFIDVKPGDFFYEPVKWAVNNKITNGTSSTTFSPYKNCNRAEIVTFLWRAAGTPEPTVTRNPFTDVNSVRDASYYKAILWASQKGITAGTNATTFSPYQECTRSQIVTFLYRYAGKPSGNYTNPFKDVSSVNEASYYNAILWAVGKGITQGTSTTTFSPYASCTRGEAVTFLYRYVNGVK